MEVVDQRKEDNKRIVKNTVYLYVRLVLSLVVGLYTSRVFLAVLGVTDYGVYNIVGGFVTMLTLFTNSITSAATRYITYGVGEGDFKKLKDTFSTILTVILVICVVLFFIGELFGIFIMDSMLNIPEDRIDSAHFVFHCSLVNFCLSIYAIPYISDIIAHERINFYAAVAIFEILFKLVIVYALYTTPFDKLETYAALLVISGVIIRFIYMQYCRKRFVEAKSKMGINRDTFRQLFSYSFWVTIGASSAVFKEQGVNILINIFFGVTINAARGVAMQIYNVVNSFGANIGTAITPQITKAYAQGDLQRSFYLTFLLTKAQGVMLLFFLIPISIEVDYLLKMWLGDVPFYSNVFTIWALILCLARTLEYTHGPLFLAIGNIKNLEIVGGGIMLLTLPICYVFLYLGFPAVSTMIISVIIEFIVMAVAFIYLKKLVSFPIYQFVKEAVLPLVIMVLTTIPLPLYLHYILPESFLRLVIIVVSSVVISCFATYFCVLSKTEKKYALQFALKKIGRL